MFVFRVAIVSAHQVHGLPFMFVPTGPPDAYVRCVLAQAVLAHALSDKVEARVSARRSSRWKSGARKSPKAYGRKPMTAGEVIGLPQNAAHAFIIARRFSNKSPR